MSDPSEPSIELAKAVWQYDDALRSKSADVRTVLESWPDERTRERLATELLRCEFEYRTRGSGKPCCKWLAFRAAELSDIICTAGSRHELYRSVYNDFVERGGQPKWEDFSALGYDAAVMRLLAKGDTVYLGQVIDDHYRLIERIAAGGCAAAFCARPLSGGEDIVVKAPLAESPEHLARNARALRTEANVLRAFARIDKPTNVRFAEYLGVTTLDNGVPLLLMKAESRSTWQDVITGRISLEG